LQLSAILAVVAFAMTIARYVPERQRPRDRIHSYSVWETVVFLMNVVAFLLMGLQARAIIGRVDTDLLWQSLGFAAIVVAVVIVVRLAWVMAYNLVRRFAAKKFGISAGPTVAQGLLVSWCGMRGLVTLATALALPETFPARDLIVLSAFAVVVGTLVVQGLTLAPLIRWLRFEPEGTFDAEVATARTALLDAAVESLEDRDDPIATRLRDEYRSERESRVRGATDEHGEVRLLRLKTVKAQRRKLNELRRSGHIDDDVFHSLEQELDWAELANSPPERLELVEG
jgi:CPA1 family monovalent cation:H+ antiporter